MKPNNNIKKIAVAVVIVTATIFTFVGVLSIWDLFSDDALWKSLSTLGVVAFGALVVAIASEHMLDKTPNQQISTVQQNYIPTVPNYNSVIVPMNQVPQNPVQMPSAPAQHTVPSYQPQQTNY